MTPPEIAAAAQSPPIRADMQPSAEAAFPLRMVPEKEPELLPAAGNMANSARQRVAYPSDWEAGQIGAVIMVDLLMKKPAFRAVSMRQGRKFARGLPSPRRPSSADSDTPRWQAEIRRHIMALTTEPRWERWFSST